MRSYKKHVSLVAVILGLAGCASEQHLVKQETARTISDTAPFKGSEGDIPYEFQERSGIEVGYNIQYVELERFSGYKLTFVFRNKSGSSVQVSPRIRLIDADGMIIPEGSYDSLMAEAALLAGTPVPPIPVAQQPYGSYHSGTIHDLNTGSTYQYSGYSQPRGGFASGFAQGAAMGAAARAAKERKYGRMMLDWLPRNWMKSSYMLDPGLAVSGSILYSAPGNTELPLKIKLDAGGAEFIFETISET